jgi:hypothetical protein
LRGYLYQRDGISALVVPVLDVPGSSASVDDVCSRLDDALGGTVIIVVPNLYNRTRPSDEQPAVVRFEELPAALTRALR